MLDPKIQLSITLTEPVLFLRSSDPSGRLQPDPNDPFTLVRGILNLHVAKPIGISSIEVELAGVLTVVCPEGIGASRVELPERNKIFSSTVTVFRADQVPQYRKRPASVGPGLGLSAANYSDNGVHTATMLASPPPSPRGRLGRQSTVNIPPELGPTPPYTSMAQSTIPTQSSFCAHAENPAQTLEELRQALRGNLEVHRNESSLATTGPPPFRRHSFALSVPNPTARCNATTASNDSLNDTRTDDMVPTSTPPDNTSFHNSIEDTPLSPNHSSRGHSPENTHETHPRTRENGRDVPTSRSRLRLSLSSVLDAVMEATSRGSSRSRAVVGSEERERGRSRVRNAGERQSPLGTGECVTGNGGQQEGNASHPSSHMEHRENYLRGLGRVFGLGLERDHEREKDSGQRSKGHEGWTEFKPGTYSYPISFLLPPNLPPTFTLPHGSLNYVIKGVVHRPGPFTSKLSCLVPLWIVAAPAIGFGEGGDPGPLLVQKQWEGKLAYSLGLSSRLLLIGSRRHLEAVSSGAIHENTESLVQVGVEARSEPEYGTVTLDLTLLPLEKIKIWKLNILVDERIRHVDEQGRLYRDDDIVKVGLLELQDTCPVEEIGLVEEREKPQKNKHKSKNGFAQIPLLPTPLSPDRSPLLRYIAPSTDSSVLAGPGPYPLTASIGLPNCNDPSGKLHFTVKQKSSGVKVEHVLRLVLRVESVGVRDTSNPEEGDKKKLFDIAVQTPIAILSCRCAPEYQTLPRYSQITQDSLKNDDRASCPCPPPAGDVGFAEREHNDIANENHEHSRHHHVSSVMTPSSMSSFGSDDSWGIGGSGFSAVSHSHSHHHDQTSDVEHWQQQQHHQHGAAPEHSRSSSRVGTARSDHASPLRSPLPHSREGPTGPGSSWSRSSSVHTHDRVSHGHGQHRHPHHRHSHSRAHTPVSTPHPSRPPSPAPAEQYERLVSGLESDAGEAPPSYYESIASNNF